MRDIRQATGAEARVGYGGLSIKIDGGSWLASGTEPASTLNRQTVFLAIFLLFKKVTAISLFNDSPAL